MAMTRGHPASHDFWGWKNCSPPQVPVYHISAEDATYVATYI